MTHNIVNKDEYRKYFKKKLRGMTDVGKSNYMRENRKKCLAISLKNKNENWFYEKLKPLTHLKFRRQALWGFRIFDFWCTKLGCAIELDGPEHKKGYDRHRDVYNYLRSGIVIIRVKNKDEQDAKEAIEFLQTLDSWPERRWSLGIKVEGKKMNLTNPRDAYWEYGKSIQSSLF